MISWQKGWQHFPAKGNFALWLSDWDSLNEKLYDSHPYFDSCFIAPLLTHFATGKELLCIHKTDTTVDAAIILEPLSCGRWKIFRPSQAQISAVLISDASLLRELFYALPNFAWSIELLAVDTRYAPCFSAIEIETITSPQAYTIGVEGKQTFNAYWAKRSKNLRANIRRYFNRLEKAGIDYKLCTISATGEISKGVANFGELESAGWKGAAGTAISPTNTQGLFYQDVLTNFSHNKHARILELYINGKVAASRLIIQSKHMLVILKTTYDEQLAQYAPGRLQLNLLLESILDGTDNSDTKHIEFYTNATQDQKEWATYGHQIENIQVFRSRLFLASFNLLKGLRLKLAAHKPISASQTAIEELPPPLIGSLPEYFTQYIYEHAPSFEATPDWFDLLKNSVYSTDSGTKFIAAKAHDKITEVWPLRLSQHRLIKQISSLSNFYTSLYHPLKAKEHSKFTLREAVAYLLQQYGSHHVIRIAPLDPNSPEFQQILNELNASGWIAFKFLSFANWYLTEEYGWDHYIKSRGANLRSTLKRRSREFLANGGLLEIITQTDSIEQAIQDFETVYAASWKKPEPFPQFIPFLIRTLYEKNALRLGVARIGGIPIAAQIWIVWNGQASIFKLAYNKQYSSYSPGTLLTAHLMKHVLDVDCVTHVDYLIGDDDYKRIWMNRRRERYGIIAYNPATIIGIFLLAREYCGRYIKRFTSKK